MSAVLEAMCRAQRANNHTMSVQRRVYSSLRRLESRDRTIRAPDMGDAELGSTGVQPSAMFNDDDADDSKEWIERQAALSEAAESDGSRFQGRGVDAAAQYVARHNTKAVDNSTMHMASHILEAGASDRTRRDVRFGGEEVGGEEGTGFGGSIRLPDQEGPSLLQVHDVAFHVEHTKNGMERRVTAHDVTVHNAHTKEPHLVQVTGETDSWQVARKRLVAMEDMEGVDPLERKEKTAAELAKEERRKNRRSLFV